MPNHPAVVSRDDWSGKAAESAIRLGALGLILVWCFLILQPFVLPFLWAVIIAVAIHPLYQKLVSMLNGRSSLAATLVTLGALVTLMVPTVMLTKRLIRNVAEVADKFRHGQLEIPPPPDAIREWPLIGDALTNAWNLALSNFAEALRLVQPQVKAIGLWLVDVAASAGLGLIILVVAFVIAGILLAHSARGHQLAYEISRRLVGERGDNFADLYSRPTRWRTLKTNAAATLPLSAVRPACGSVCGCGPGPCRAIRAVAIAPEGR